MGLWEKFKSSFGGETTDAAQKVVEPARFYEGTNTELKPKTHVETTAMVTDISSATETYEMAINYYRVSHDEYKQDLPKAISLFEKAAACNHPEAMIYLAEMFLSGMGCTRDSVKGLEYLHKAEKLSEDKSLKLLAVHYSNSNIDRALKYYERYFETDDFKKYFKYEDDGYKDDGLVEFYELLVKNKKPLVNKFIDKYKKTIIDRYTLSYDNYAEWELEDEGSDYTNEKKHINKMIKILDPNYKSPSNKSMLRQASKNNDDDFLDTLSLKDGYDENTWDEPFETAEAYYFGLGDEIQDYKEALKYYKKAADLGSGEALIKLGIMYRDGEGCNKSSDKALEYFKEGVKYGNINCYAEMARLFIAFEHIENASKCWDKFFNSDDLNNNRNVASYSMHYLISVRYNDIAYKFKHKLLPHKKEIAESIERVKTLYSMDGDQENANLMNGYYEYLS